jgi:hypothetical protein
VRVNDMEAVEGLRVHKRDAGGWGLGPRLEIVPLGLNFACAVSKTSWGSSRRWWGALDGVVVCLSDAERGGGLLVLTFYLPIPIFFPNYFSTSHPSS